MLHALVDSYAVFLPQAGLPVGDFSAAIAHAVADSFALGVQLAAPFVVVSLVYNIGMGLLGRLVPQLQVFFFGLPIQLSLQICVMMLTDIGHYAGFPQPLRPVRSGRGRRLSVDRSQSDVGRRPILENRRSDPETPAAGAGARRNCAVPGSPGVGDAVRRRPRPGDAGTAGSRAHAACRPAFP